METRLNKLDKKDETEKSPSYIEWSFFPENIRI